MFTTKNVELLIALTHLVIIDAVEECKRTYLQKRYRRRTPVGKLRPMMVGVVCVPFEEALAAGIAVDFRDRA